MASKIKVDTLETANGSGSITINNPIIAKGISSTTLGTSNFVAGVNAGNSIVSGGNNNTVVGDESGTAITTGDDNTCLLYTSPSPRD